MADPVIEPKTPEDLIKALTEIRTELAAGATRTDKMESEIKATLQGIRLAQGEAAIDSRNRASEPDTAIVSRYSVSEDEAKALDERSIAKTLAGVDSKRDVSYFASKSGVIRLLGDEDDAGDYQPGLLDDPAPANEWHRELQRRVNDLGLYRMSTGNTRARKLVKRIVNHLRRGPPAIAKVFADNTTEGGEFIADVLLPEVFTTLRLPSMLAQKFARTTIPTGGTTTNPFWSGGCQPFILGVPTSGDMNPAEMVKSVPTTASVSVAPVTLGVALPANRDASEDSIVEWGGFASLQLSNALVDGEEDAIVNGDTAGTHQDSIAAWAGPSSRWAILGQTGDHRKSWIGLRARAFDVSATADQSAAQTVADAIGWRANLAGAYRGTPQDLLYVISLGHLIKKWLTDSNFLTMDKAGPMAGLFTGAVGMLGGIPVHVSDYVTEDLNASGLFDNVTLDYTTGLLVNHRRFQIAERRGARVEVDVQPLRHVAYHIASLRQAFRTVDTSSTKNVFAAYKLTK
jgi:HK97 family phage major capsid protein